MLKVTEILLPTVVASVWDMPKIETKTDAHRVLGDYKAVWAYVEEFGNQLVEFDAAANVYRVPAFDVVRDAYIASKVRDCERYGCE